MLDYFLSSLYMLYFGLLLLLFHVYQVIAFNFFGKKAHRRSVDQFNYFLTVGWYMTGARISFRFRTELPTDRPLIFTPNHQSTFDIPPLIYYLRKYHPIFVSKIELARGIPSISYNLRKSGAALINRKDGKQAIMEIARLGKLIQEHNYSTVIFPEGTRTASGTMRPFAAGGIATLLKKAPDALVVPVAIQGTGRFNPKGLFPLTAFSSLSWTVLTPIEPKGLKPEEVVKLAQEAIQEVLDAAEGHGDRA